MEVLCGSLRDTNLGSILGAFGVPLGSLGASLWEKMGFGKASKKWSEKRVCKEFREFGGKWGKAPVRPYKPSFLEPSGSFVGHSLPNVGVLCINVTRLLC